MNRDSQNQTASLIQTLEAVRQRKRHKNQQLKVVSFILFLGIGFFAGHNLPSKSPPPPVTQKSTFTPEPTTEEYIELISDEELISLTQETGHIFVITADGSKKLLLSPEF